MVKPRLLIGKAGLDKHDRGAQIVARSLRDAGYEVVYIDAGELPVGIARIAVDEDVAAIGLSILSGAHLMVFRELLDALEEAGASDIRLFAGGTIPPRDELVLKGMGVLEVFGPGTATTDIVAQFDRHLAPETNR
jgi:methylmalonyl-CoA mutase C-terminal domain/subunit